MIVVMTFLPPPSVNVYYRRAGHHIHISLKGQQYKKMVADTVSQHYPQKFNDMRLKVHIDYYPATKRKTDLDNRFKALLDSLTDAGVWLDDEQIDELSIKRMPVYKGGKVIVTVENLDAN